MAKVSRTYHHVTYVAGDILDGCEFIEYLPAKNKARQGLFRCFCGNEFKTVVSLLADGRKKAKGCGCLWRAENAQKVKKTKSYRGIEYNSWQAAKARCYRKTHEQYPNYGGRFIRMEGRWRYSFDNFLEDMGRRPTPQHTLERRNVNGNYCKENCYWGTIEEQSNNKQYHRYLTIDGETKNIAQWAKISGLNHSLICLRIKKGWSPKEAVFKPADQRFNSMKYLSIIILLILSQFAYSQCGTPTVYNITYTSGAEWYRGPTPWSGGDTVKIMGVNYDLIEFYGGGGTYSCPVVIVANSTVHITTLRFNGGAHNYKMISTGGGKDTTTNRSIRAGMVAGGWAKYVEINGLEIGGAGFDNAVYWKRDVSYSDPMTWSSNYKSTGNQFLNCFMHDTGGEIMYYGNTQSSGSTVTSSWSGLDTLIWAVFVDSVTIANNIMLRGGWDGCQVSNARGGSNIYNNYIKDVGLDNEPSQMAGIILGGNSSGNVYNNVVINAKGNGIENFGYNTMSLSGNTITNSGEASIFANSYPTSSNLSDPLQQLIITNNKINNPPLDGAIRLYNDFRSHAGHTLLNNNFCIPGALPNWQDTYFTIYTPPPYTNTNNILYCESDCNCVITNVLRGGKYVN